MNPQEFANLANTLLGQQNIQSEALYRTVVGRLYYSVYHEVRDWLESRFPQEWENTTGKTHERLSNCCYNLQTAHKEIKFSDFGRKLESLKKHRVRADYRLDEYLTLFDIQKILLEYKNLQQKLETLKTTYP